MAGIGELHRRFHDAAEAAELTLDELWLRYFTLGGLAGRFEVDAYVNGAIAMPPVEHDILALAINERLDELAPPRAPYSEEFAELGGAPDAGEGGDGSSAAS